MRYFANKIEQIITRRTIQKDRRILSGLITSQDVEELRDRMYVNSASFFRPFNGFTIFTNGEVSRSIYEIDEIPEYLLRRAIFQTAHDRNLKRLRRGVNIF